jgi:sn-glycerol 3-phosphate transport system substrate-binding protein
MMPYSPDVLAKPQNSIIGGATLWVCRAGRRRVQGRRQVHELPVEHAGAGQVAPGDGLRADHDCAADATEKEGFYKKFPGRDIAVKELTLNPPTRELQGPCASATSCRSATSSTRSWKQVWSGKKDAKAALDEAVKRGNELLKRFEAQNK